MFRQILEAVHIERDDLDLINEVSSGIATSLGIERKARESPTDICTNMVEFEQ